MAPAVERREHPRPSLSGSPTNRGRRSPRRRSPSRRERSPVIRSPVRTSSSHRPRSPSKQKQSDRARSPRHTSSRSPSPRTKRLRRAQAGREEEKSVEGERRRNSSREEREDKDARRDRKGDGERSSRRGRSISPEEHGRRGRHGSRSPSRAAKGRTRDEDVEARAAVSSRDDDPDSLAKMNAAAEALEAKEKQKPSFELSGKLAEETNRVRGVTLLFTEPPEARKPDVRWRLYVFKAGEVLNDPLYVHRQSCYLFGRERRVADVPTDHPSCSKQHAVLQFRVVEKEQPDGLMSKQVRPYVMDLDSTNGTFINDNRIEPRRYYELFEKDTIKFGNSSREYVLLHENSMG